VSGENPPELTAAMRLAEARGFRFMQVTPGAAWWGERETAQWSDVVFLNPSGLCNAVRSSQSLVILHEPLFTKRVSGDALTVLRTVCEDWPI
jgi:hypothetical protein